MNIFLEKQQKEHSNILSSVLKHLEGEKEADLLIICDDNESVLTSRTLFCIFSKTLRDIFKHAYIYKSSSISLPMTSAAVRNLVNVLLEGKTFAKNKDDLIEVTAAAKLLDIDFKELQVGSRNPKELSHLNQSDVIVEAVDTENITTVADEEEFYDNNDGVDQMDVVHTETQKREIDTLSEHIFSCEECYKHFPDERHLKLHRHFKHSMKLDADVH